MAGLSYRGIATNAIRNMQWGVKGQENAHPRHASPRSAVRVLSMLSLQIQG